MVTHKFTTTLDSETYALGAKLAANILSLGIKRIFVAVYGDLGAGKTVFTRGFSSVIAPKSRVKSPTYTIVNEYLSGDVPLYHFDFYRINNVQELDGIGFDDYLENGICIAEWCEKLGDELPENIITVKIEKLEPDGRNITIEFLQTEVFSDVDTWL